MSLNVWTFTGRVGRDAELRTTGGGKEVCGFPVAVDVGWGDSKETLWVDCSLWGPRASKIAPHIAKGGSVSVSGEAGIRSYEHKGEAKTTITCNVREIALQGGKPAQQQAPRQQPTTTANGGGPTDDIPFRQHMHRTY